MNQLMTYYNEATVAAQIANAKTAAANNDLDAAFYFLGNALDCSGRNTADLALIDAAYAEIKA